MTAATLGRWLPHREPATTYQAPVVTGLGVAVGGLAGVGDLLLRQSGADGYDPVVGLQGRAMRHKDRASRFALRAAEAALRDAELFDGHSLLAARDHTCVVVSTNLGNLDSVCEFTDTIAERSVLELSPLGLPHTSANSVAGWVAIQYGLRGPNVTVCNGATGGLDALYWAGNLIAAGRATIAVVVGVEPDTLPVGRLLGDPVRLDGAVCVVLESVPHQRARGVTARAAIAGYARQAGLDDAVRVVRTAKPVPVDLWLTRTGSRAAALPEPTPTWDISERLGECGGALGVLQCAAAVSYLDSGGGRAVLATCGSDGDGTAALLITAAGQAQ